MKKIIFIYLFFSQFLGFSQIISIPDQNFKNALLNHTPTIDKNSDGEIQILEAKKFSGTITVHDKNIYDLTGIESFINITGLICSDNYLTTIDLTGNQNITQLFCSFNDLTNINISNCLDLYKLNCSFNVLTNIDISNNISLYDFDCSGNSLSEIDLSYNLDLHTLNLSCNSLTQLDISNNIELYNIHCGANDLFELDISNNINLYSLNCGANNLTELDLKNIELRELYCGFNNFENGIDVSHLSNLKIFSIMDANLTSLDVSRNLLLYDLYFDFNRIKSIDISNNYYLSFLSFGTNQITEIDLSNNPKISGVWCPYNNLTSLEVTNKPFLSMLYCHQNNLRFLDMRNSFYGFMNLDVTGNPNLSCIYVDDKEYVINNWDYYIDSTSTFVESEAECEALTDTNELNFNTFNCFPNPFINTLHIETNITDNYTISLYNMMGQKVLKSKSGIIDTSHFINGFYLLKIEFDNGISITKNVIRIGA